MMAPSVGSSIPSPTLATRAWRPGTEAPSREATPSAMSRPCVSAQSGLLLWGGPDGGLAAPAGPQSGPPIHQVPAPPALGLEGGLYRTERSNTMALATGITTGTAPAIPRQIGARPAR